MEDTLGVMQAWLLTVLIMSLNPCFNGRYSRSNVKAAIEEIEKS